MYGYLRDLTLHKSTADPVAYRGYYCGMCCAIAHVLGASKVFLNNRDVVGVAILLKLNRGQECTAKCCYCFTKKGKSKYTTEWKKMVIFAVGLLYAKVLDDIEDGNEKKAQKTLKKIEKTLAKCNEIVPDFTKQIEDIMGRFFEKEKASKSILEQGEFFGESFAEMLSILFDAEEPIMLDRLRALAVWYCLVDAVDDYEKDYKSGGKNPLFAIAKKKSLKDFDESEKQELKTITEEVCARLKKLSPNPCVDKEDEMIEYYFNVWCPSQLEKLLKKIENKG